MQRDRLYLIDIVEAADAVSAFLATRDDENAFLADELLKSAVLQKLTVIGEAAARLSGEIKKQHADVPWLDIVAFRNIAVHAYFAVDWSIVWATATNDTPALRRQVQSILVAEFPESQPPGDV